MSFHNYSLLITHYSFALALLLCVSIWTKKLFCYYGILYEQPKFCPSMKLIHLNFV